MAVELTVLITPLMCSSGPGGADNLRRVRHDTGTTAPRPNG
jgi:hypothetical protein